VAESPSLGEFCIKPAAWPSLARNSGRGCIPTKSSSLKGESIKGTAASPGVAGACRAFVFCTARTSVQQKNKSAKNIYLSIREEYVFTSPAGSIKIYTHIHTKNSSPRMERKEGFYACAPWPNHHPRSARHSKCDPDVLKNTSERKMLPMLIWVRLSGPDQHRSGPEVLLHSLTITYRLPVFARLTCCCAVGIGVRLQKRLYIHCR